MNQEIRKSGKGIQMIVSIWLLLLVCMAGDLRAENDARLQNMEQSLSSLESHHTQMEQNISKQIKDSADTGIVLILFGAFCALWAQNTGRSAWLWFFFGMFLHIIAVITLLVKNSNDRRRKHESTRFQNFHTS